MVLASEFAINFIEDPQSYAKVQQHGIDLSVKSIGLHRTINASVLVDRTTIDFDPQLSVLEPRYTFLSPKDSRCGWKLAPGYYNIIFDQGVTVPANCKANIIHRSSIARAGGWLFSAEYDPGFKTEFAGAFLLVHSPMFIEEHARIAQIVFYEVKGEITPYNGQWQGK